MTKGRIILNWVTLISIIVLLVSMCSCSASWHIRQAQRKAPEMFADTTVLQTVDTVIIEVPRVETKLQFKTDTLIKYVDTSTEQPVEIRYKYSTITDSIYLSADCPDTEVITKEIIKTNTVTIKPTLWQQLQWSVYIIASIILLSIVYRLSSKN